MSNDLNNKMVLDLLRTRKQQDRERLEKIEKDIVGIEYSKTLLVTNIEDFIKSNKVFEMSDHRSAMVELQNIHNDIFNVDQNIIEYNREVKMVNSIEKELNIACSYEKLPFLNNDTFYNLDLINDLLFKAISGDEVIKNDKSQHSNKLSEVLSVIMNKVAKPEIEELEVNPLVFHTVEEAKEGVNSLDLASQSYKLIDDVKSHSRVSSLVNTMLELILLSNNGQVVYSSFKSLHINHPKNFTVKEDSIGTLITTLKKMKWLDISKGESKLTKTIHIDHKFLDNDTLINLLYLISEHNMNKNTLSLFQELYNGALDTGITMIDQPFKAVNYLNLKKLTESKLITVNKLDVYINKEIFIDK